MMYKEGLLHSENTVGRAKGKANSIYEDKYRFSAMNTMSHHITEYLRFTLLLIVCLYFVLSCTSSSIVQGIPVNASSRSPRDQQPRRLRKSNPDLNRVFTHPTITIDGQLLSRTGYFLEILQNGTIQATLNNSSIYTKLEMQSYNRTLKRFKGIHSEYFLACEIRNRRRGIFIGVRSLSTNSLFIEHMEENGYTTYRPLDFPTNNNNTGHLAIKVNGKFRRIERSTPGMHASQFTFLNH